MGHVRMMGAIQPFISGAISKTVNMPEAATAEEIEKVYLEGWKLGLKAIAVYRDNSKRSQPLSHRQEEGRRRRRHRGRREAKKELAKAQAEAALPHRRRLPSERTAVTHKFDIAGHEGYITVGLYPDGQPGEIFLKMAKEGSTVSRADGLVRDDRVRGAPVRRAAARSRQQVRPCPVRAVRVHGQPGDPDREVDRGLHLPVAGVAVPRADDKAALGSAGSSREFREPRLRLFGGVRPSGRAARSLTLAPSNARSGRTAYGRRRGVDGTGRTHGHASTERRASAAGLSGLPRTRQASVRSRVSQYHGRGRGLGLERSLLPGSRRARGRGHQWPGHAEGVERQRLEHRDAVAGQGERRLQDPGGRPELRRMRLDHGPQRLLLQVPELRLHERLLVSS